MPRRIIPLLIALAAAGAFAQPAEEIPAELKRVAKYAELAIKDIHQSDPYTKMVRLPEAAALAQRGGKKELADKTFMASTAIWMTFEDKDYATECLADGYAMAGEVEKFRAAVKQYETNQYYASSAAIGAYSLYYYANKPDAAKKMIDDIAAANAKAAPSEFDLYVKLDLVWAMALSKQYDRAIALAKQEKQVSARMSMLYAVAYEQAYWGEKDAARKTYQMAEDLAPHMIAAHEADEFAPYLWADQILVHAELGNEDAIRVILAGREDVDEKADIMTRLATAQNVNGKRDEARMTLKAVENMLANNPDEATSYGWARLAAIRTRLDLLPEGDLKAWVNQHQHPEVRAEMYMGIAYGLYDRYYDKHVRNKP